MRTADRIAWAKHVGQAGARRPHKYHARATTVDGIRFDSRKEANRYRDLTILAALGQIQQLEMHPQFSIAVVELFRGLELGPSVVACGVYTADFRYVTTAGEVIVEDVKSGPTRTEAYRLRKRLVEAIHGITIREI